MISVSQEYDSPAVYVDTKLFLMRSAPFSAMVGALVLPLVTKGMMDASMTFKLSISFTVREGSIRVVGSSTAAIFEEPARGRVDGV